jgi:N-acetylmuramoyl-L-alanine amidase/Putative peptidoglycan binding domain
MTNCLPHEEEFPDMVYSLAWLPDALLGAGLKVAPVDGWEIRGRGDVGRTLGILCHHTAGPKNGNMPSLDTIIHGRPDLNGPLAQLGLGRDGTFYVIAAGRCNHAGEGAWRGLNTGNTNFIGIEAENTGLPDDTPWPAIQIDAYQRGVAAILKHAGLGPEWCAGHKEYAPNRKTDPTLNMDNFRATVGGILSGTVPQAVLIPAAEPPPQPGAVPGRPTLRRGSQGDLVKTVQRALNLGTDGNFGGQTEAAVRNFQRAHNMVPDGIVGPKTWTALDTATAPPTAVASATGASAAGVSAAA